MSFVFATLFIDGLRARRVFWVYCLRYVRLIVVVCPVCSCERVIYVARQNGGGMSVMRIQPRVAPPLMRDAGMRSAR